VEDTSLLLGERDRKAAKEEFSILNSRRKGLNLPVIAGSMFDPDAAGQSGTATKGGSAERNSIGQIWK